ncbi:AzlD domain-containing protein [Anaerophilus nitritogenes]|uniref:AzlD domain-containing protein n=1 Tax=Anaerophilus nitritogenes TaxID=2498136 RepID=UPI001930F397|nr:AzlD domain-containing protein [Anaerophilus nitritogenes]
MEMNNYILLIVGMMIVTYIPKLIPFFILSKEKIPTKLNKFLKLIPYTALGALLIPDVFYTTPSIPQASILGIGFAAIYVWHKGGIIIPILGSIFVTFIVILVHTG